jgi:UDP:flavonoid glycosyltransferase YjiC (YdhE family)
MSLLGKKLQEQGDIVNFSSFDYVVEYLRKKGFNCDRTSSMQIGWREGGVSATNTIRQIPRLFSTFVQQYRQERRIIKRFSPDIVVSDSRLSAVIAAFISGIPSLTISNQLRILLPPRYHTTSLNKVERIDAELLGIFWSRSQLLLVPDLPPPYTISELNTQEGKTMLRKIQYIGFLTPRSEISGNNIKRISDLLELDGRKKIIFAQISGPPETIDIIMQSAYDAAKLLSEKFIFIISKGKVGGDETPKKIHGGWIFDWCPIKDELFYISDILVLRGGHSSLSQAILSKKPLVTIPIRNHSEQVMNSQKISQIGLGINIDPAILTGSTLAKAIESIMGNKLFKTNANKIGDVALNLNGVNNTIKLMKSIL